MKNALIATYVAALALAGAAVPTAGAADFRLDPQVLDTTLNFRGAGVVALETDRESSYLRGTRFGMNAVGSGVLGDQRVIDLEPEIGAYPTMTPTYEPSPTPFETPWPTVTPYPDVSPTPSPGWSATPTFETPTPIAQPGAPVMRDEPACSPGTSNQVFWSDENIPPASEFQVVCAADPEFREVVRQSPWTADTDWTFAELDSDVEYFFRVRGRLPNQEIGPWSNMVSTRQDNSAPHIWAGGFWDSRMMRDRMSGLTIVVVIPEEPVEVEIYYEDLPTGYFLTDDGAHGDLEADDGFYALRVEAIADIDPRSYMISLVATDCAGNSARMNWPFLEVR